MFFLEPIEGNDKTMGFYAESGTAHLGEAIALIGTIWNQNKGCYKSKEGEKVIFKRRASKRPLESFLFRLGRMNLGAIQAFMKFSWRQSFHLESKEALAFLNALYKATRNQACNLNLGLMNGSEILKATVTYSAKNNTLTLHCPTRIEKMIGKERANLEAVKEMLSSAFNYQELQVIVR